MLPGMPPCLALHICSKAKVAFTKITSSCMTQIDIGASEALCLPHDDLAIINQATGGNNAL